LNEQGATSKSTVFLKRHFKEAAISVKELGCYKASLIDGEQNPFIPGMGTSSTTNCFVDKFVTHPGN